MATAKRTTRKKKETSIIDSVINLKPEDIVNEIGGLQNSLQGTLAGLSAQISSKVEQMRTVDEAISIKKTELQDLYGIEEEAMSLEEVRASRALEDEEWEKRLAQRNSDWQEEEAEQDKRFQRMEEQRQYEYDRKVQQAQADFASNLAEKQKQEQFRLLDLERSWDEREAEIASKETEFNSLKSQVEGFDEKLKAEVSKAEAIISNRFKKDHAHEIAMLRREMESQSNLNDTKIESLNITIEGLNDQIEDLQKQLTEARNDSKEITSAALQSASGRTAMEAMQRVVDSSGQATKK